MPSRPTKNVFKLHGCTVLWLIHRALLWSSAQTTPPSQILWALAPCQSAFWIPSTTSEFNSNWITYLYEGNPISQLGECVFTLESDPKTRIEIVIQEVNLFGSDAITPPPCLELYDVKQDGSIVSLKKECQAMLSANALESQSTFTETNLAVISTTLRYGSFQLQARAVPKSFNIPMRVSSTTPTSTSSTSTPTFTFNVTSSTTTTTTKNSSTTTTSKPTIVTPTTNPSTRILQSDLLRYGIVNSDRG